MSDVRPPPNVEVLMARARRLAGWTLGEVASELGMEVPTSLRRAKGWVGMLMERALGTTAGAKPVPDFEELGVELKTIPIESSGAVRETTYVCMLTLDESAWALTWETSRARLKLEHVLWMPIEANRDIPLADRRIGQPVLWRPTPYEEALLRADWEGHMELVREGAVDEITAHAGKVLQVRPKAANARVRTWAVDADGEPMLTLPRGFYLRTSFTQALIARALSGIPPE